jgi:enterochelin esterase-like enzyme
MPNKKSHIEKARHNTKFYASFDLHETPFKDWVVVGVFYSALHIIDAYLVTKGEHSFSHITRDSWIKNRRELDPVWFDYRDLKELRMQASYKCRAFSADEIKKEVIPLLDSIRNTIQFLDPSIIA